MDVWPIGEWLDELRDMGRAPTTIKLRDYYLCRFARSNPDPWAVGRDDVVRALGTVARPETKKSYRSSLHSFYEWAIRSGLTLVDPTVGLMPIAVPPAQPRPVPEDVIRRAWDCADPDTQLMIWLAAGCGLRRMEVAKVSTYDVAGDRLWVTGKGEKRRAVPLAPELRDTILARPRGWLFPSPRYPGRPVTAWCVGDRLSIALGPGYAAHGLRHRYATVGVEGTRDLLAAQRSLGHSSVATTQRYVGVEAGRLDAFADAARLTWAVAP